ncbi:MAG TPA: serpin family protein [Sporichthyaceae bacterium]|nr:serpin family protein [Sporichthyaceae bacterium]
MSGKRRTQMAAAGVALGASLAACGAGHEVVAGPSAAIPSSTPTATPTASASPGSTPAAAMHRVAPSADAPVAATVAGINQFAIDLYRVGAKPGDNFVFSPLSVAYAFGMLRAGAKGETGDQIDKAFGFPAGVAEAFNALTKGLVTSTAPPQASPQPSANSIPAPAPPVLTIANSLFVQTGYPLEQEFLNTLGQQYGSTVRETDFGDESAALAAINHWADVHTAGRIKQILEHLDPATRLALLNAVYLKASWTTAFDQAGEDKFRGVTKPVQMIDSDGRYGYAKGTGWQAVQLPYFGGRLAMRVVLPTGATTPADLMTPAVLAAAGRTLPAYVNVTMPKWDFRSDLDLIPLLKTLGITDVFGPADLSGITTAEALYVDQALHKANITVDELGTTAAAVTAITARAVSAVAGPTPPIIFTVDRPFVFEIVDTKTGALLFIGSVANPSAK